MSSPETSKSHFRFMQFEIEKCSLSRILFQTWATPHHKVHNLKLKILGPESRDLKTNNLYFVLLKSRAATVISLLFFSLLYVSYNFEHNFEGKGGKIHDRSK